MLGGEKNDIIKATPILNLIGDTLKDCGGPGMGSRMKIVNNYMTTVLNVLSGEALTLARAVGLDQETCIDVLSGTAAVKSHLTTTYPTKVLNNDVTPAFMVKLALKDLGIAVDLGKKVNTDLDLGRASIETYKHAIKEGREEQDWTSIFLSLQNRAGLSLPDSIKK
jgi:4-hydroxybutyrate dehydrogenase/sulfolactaldehyde 3-reductase